MHNDRLPFAAVVIIDHWRAVIIITRRASYAEAEENDEQDFLEAATHPLEDSHCGCGLASPRQQ
jgi:hypothetical protein